MRHKFPEPDQTKGTILGALTSAHHPSGVGVFACGGGLSHLRADTPEGVVNRLEVFPFSSDEIFQEVRGPVLYGGPLFAHFGHMVAESIHRLWACRVFPELRDLPVAFHANNPVRRPAWLEPVMAACGISADRLLLINRPTQFDLLHVPKQGRALGGGILIPEYLSLFPLKPIFPENGVNYIYVSRSRHIRSGSYLGESLVESILREIGFHIIYPEETPLEKFLSQLSAAKKVIFSEGSALHNLELTGPIPADVMIIGRRDGTRRRFQELMEPLCRRLKIFSRAKPIESLDWDNVKNGPRVSTACSFLSLIELFDAIGEFTGKHIPPPSESVIQIHVANDLLMYIMDERSGPNSSDELLGKALRSIRKNQNVKDLYGF